MVATTNKTTSEDKAVSPTKRTSRTVKINKAQQRVLNATAILAARKGCNEVPRSQVQAMIGNTSKSGFASLLSGMKKQMELISYPDKDTMALTDAGREHADMTDEILMTTNQGLLEKAKQDVKGKKGKELFDILSDGQMHTRAECAERLGYEKPAQMASLMSVMKSQCVLEYCKDEEGNQALKLPDSLFPFGRESAEL
jgi:hypothetical protein